MTREEGGLETDFGDSRGLVIIKMLVITCGKSKPRMAPHRCSRLSCCHILRPWCLSLGQLDDWWQRESFEECDLDTPDSRLSFTSDSHQSNENDPVLLTKEKALHGAQCLPNNSSHDHSHEPKAKGLSLQWLGRRYRTRHAWAISFVHIKSVSPLLNWKHTFTYVFMSEFTSLSRWGNMWLRGRCTHRSTNRFSSVYSHLQLVSCGLVHRADAEATPPGCKMI